MNNKTKIISAFPACGKSYLYGNQELLGCTVSDSDSSMFSWVEVDGKKERNPKFPENYIQHIRSLIGEVDYILVSSHEEVRDLLESEKLPYTFVKPCINLKEEWLGRCWLRGNDDSFLNLLNNNFYMWVAPSDTRTMCLETIELGSGEYLKDKLGRK